MSDNQVILCPSCGKPVPIAQVLRSQVEEQVKKSLALEFAEKLEAEKKQSYAAAIKQAEAKSQLKLKELTQLVADREKSLQAAEAKELEFLKKEREMADKERRMELTIEKKLAERLETEVIKARQSAVKEAQETLTLTLSQKEKQIEQMQKKIDDLQRQSKQGSMQVQGDAAETSLKEQLSREFVEDEITDVATGVRGADLIQKVGKKLGRLAGTILWESKQTKAFSETWLPKLKTDQQSTRANLCVLVSAVVPDQIRGFGLIKGVWVCETSYAVPLAYVLRQQLSELYRQTLSLENRQEKTVLLHRYLTSQEFRSHVENQVMAYQELKEGLDRERAAMTTIWNRREKQLQKFLNSTAGIYGDLQGIIGGALPVISHLELGNGRPVLENHEKTEPGLFDENKHNQ